MMGEHTFCRALLKELMRDVRKHVKPEIVKEAWGYRRAAAMGGRQTVEFHIPSQDFYWHGQGCCVWYAKHEGWTAYLRELGVDGYTLEQN